MDGPAFAVATEARADLRVVGVDQARLSGDMAGELVQLCVGGGRWSEPRERTGSVGDGTLGVFELIETIRYRMSGAH